ncbi:Uncharacterized protein APZ42_012705 [Daphnia magna]|uniref:Integrase catalytic domain-containing protein n=1 Tax=Daphnia magna TaxID=35525 RepID=A0A162RJV4_9CRUS|nr:Uncharacterized protein APZ42_012705 [Daphnia magna]
MLRDVKEYFTSCEPCALGRRVHSTKAYLNPLDLATRPFEVLGLDFLEVIPLTNCTALSTSKALVERIILHHGPLKAIITDRGSNFTSELFSALRKALNIKRMKTTAKSLENGFERWEDILGPIVFAYNNSLHSSTLKTPYFLNHGRDPVMPIDQLLRPIPPVIVTPSDYESQIMKRLNEAFQLVKINLSQAREQQKASTIKA